mgnify:CR=1 FL=1
MAISYSQSDVKKIVDSLVQAIDELGRVNAALDEVTEQFHQGVPDGKWSTEITSEAEAIAQDADKIAEDLKNEIKGIQDSFNQLSVATVNFIVQNAELEDAAVSAITSVLPDDVEGNIDNISPLGKES